MPNLIDISEQDVVLPTCRDRTWAQRAIALLRGDRRRSADTHLLNPVFPGLKGITIYFKDESTHPTGSLKHRLAHSLFLYGICNGNIAEGTTLVEASSGSTAVSEAYFAHLLDLPFIAVMPRTVSRAKIEAIERFGGRCHFVEIASAVYDEAARVAAEANGHYLDQFTYAERATDWRGNNNIAESIFEQMASERFPIPTWIVVGAGTGGTSATIGRFIRYRRSCCTRTRLAVVDPEGSVFAEHWQTGRTDLHACGSRIEGIGRPRVEPSFQRHVIDRMIPVADKASFAAARALSAELGKRVGPSTGTNMVGVLALADEMAAQGQQGSIVSLICDAGERYMDTLYDDACYTTHCG